MVLFAIKMFLKFGEIQDLLLLPKVALNWLREVRLKSLCLQIQRCIELLRVTFFDCYQFICRGRDVRQVSLVDIQLFYRLKVYFSGIHTRNE
jgi:hypothetical protein